MASQAKRKKDTEDDDSDKKMKLDDGENISRTGRQRKKSAKVLEMEAEADELAQVLRARVDSSATPRARPPVQRGPRVKKTPIRPDLEACKEESDDEPERAATETSPPALGAETSKSGRVRKKSAKLLEMVEVEELDRKTFRTSHIPKSMRNAIIPSQPTPTKKAKPQTATSPGEVVSGSPPASSPSAIKQLLSSPSKKSPGATSPPPEPILSMLGASLASPIKTIVQTSPVIKPAQLPVTVTSLSAAIAPAATAVKESQEDFKVKFLTDCPDVVVTPKPVKKKSKKQATPTPSAPATVKPVEVAAPQKAMLPKLKNLLSPPKKTTGVAASMADQPLLSKMMGEVGHIGPPPPSSAEAKSMKKRAKKEAAAALKHFPEIVKKKIGKEAPSLPELQRQFVLPKPPTLPQPAQFAAPPATMPTLGLALSSVYDEDEEEEEDEEDQLMIDTTKIQAKKKKAKGKKGKDEGAPQLELAVMPPALPTVLPDVAMMVDDTNSGGEEDEEEEEEEEEEDDAEEDVDVEVPTYQNTNVMANKLQTSGEKKASKEKKKKKGKKDDPDKQRKKRGPTAYMLWCNAHRAKLVKDNPGIDFATISKRLGEMWSGQTDKEKMAWKRKAKKLASKGSTVISTGKGVSQMVHGGSGATLLNRPAQSKSAKAAAAHPPAASRAAAPAAAHPRTGHDQEPPSPVKSNGCAPLDVAAHLKLLGESLSIIGARLQEHHGQIAVQGTLPVLLDSLLCALGPLTCLTTNVPQLDGTPITTHAKTLDNIAYIMPGIG